MQKSDRISLAILETYSAQYNTYVIYALLFSRRTQNAVGRQTSRESANTWKTRISCTCLTWCQAWPVCVCVLPLFWQTFLRRCRLGKAAINSTDSNVHERKCAYKTAILCVLLILICSIVVSTVFTSNPRVDEPPRVRRTGLWLPHTTMLCYNVEYTIHRIMQMSVGCICANDVACHICARPSAKKRKIAEERSRVAICQAYKRYSSVSTDRPTDQPPQPSGRVSDRICVLLRFRLSRARAIVVTNARAMRRLFIARWRIGKCFAYHFLSECFIGAARSDGRKSH